MIFHRNFVYLWWWICARRKLWISVLRKFEFDFYMCSLRCKLCSCVVTFWHAATSAVHMEKCCDFCSSSGEMLRLLQWYGITHLLNSLPRGNSVDCLPRAASCLEWILMFDFNSYCNPRDKKVIKMFDANSEPILPPPELLLRCITYSTVIFMKIWPPARILNSIFRTWNSIARSYKIDLQIL